MVAILSPSSSDSPNSDRLSTLVRLCLEATSSPSKTLALDVGESASRNGELKLDISTRLLSVGDRPSLLSEELLSEELSCTSNFLRETALVPALGRGDRERGFLTKGDVVTLSR